MKVQGEEVVVYQQHMLTGILSIPDSTADLATYTKYELAPRSPSLFDGVPVRRPAMAALASLLLSLVPAGLTDMPQNAVHAVDGGYLLHTVV